MDAPLDDEVTATTALVPTSALDSNGEPIVCHGMSLLSLPFRAPPPAQLITRRSRCSPCHPTTACKLGLEETLDNTVVQFGRYLFQ